MKKKLKNKKLKKDVTFFYSDHIEKNTWVNLKKRLKNKGYKTRFSNKLRGKAEIGFYNHDLNINNNSKFSIISLHGMDQGRTSWPNAWKKTRWDLYDIGLLPGKKWVNLWKTSCKDPKANPRNGVYEIGWPKSDDINSTSFKQKVKKIKKKINPNKKTILYAPSFETDNKQLDILNLAKKKGLNLIVKHWPSKDDKKYSDIYKNTIKMNNISKQNYKDVYIYPPKTNIFLYLAIADILITDESSVMYEAMLFNVPTIIPNDWSMRINNSNKPRKIMPSSDAYLNCQLNDLSKNISLTLNNLSEVKKIIKKQKKLHFSYIENSSEKIFNLIEKIINNDLSYKSINVRKPLKRSIFERIKKYFLK